MPLSERDPNVSGRLSRASTASMASAGSKGLLTASLPKSDGTVAPGVMSMLRTSTELGDIGAPSLPSRKPAAQRGPHRRSGTGTASYLSSSSAQTQPSKRVFNHQAWPSASSEPRRSLTSNLTVPNYTSESFSLPQSHMSKDGRSLSMTHTTHPSHMLPTHRSFTSLRSHEPLTRPRSPYRYPTRLKRPGYRPSSPALSDITGVPLQRIHGAGTGSGMPARRMLRPQGTSFARLSPYAQSSNLSAPTVSTPFDGRVQHGFYPQSHSISITSFGGPMARRPGSVSSSSAVPSSDPPSSAPPTPRHYSSLEVVVDPTHIPGAFPETPDELTGRAAPGGPLYYDYSEQFEREAYQKPQESAIPLGFVQRIKTILEERATVNSAFSPDPVPNTSAPSDDEIAELPASPVIQRITRELILAAIEPSSDGAKIDGVPVDPAAGDEAADGRDSTVSESIANEGAAPSTDSAEKRHSTKDASTTDDSVISDDTVDLTVRYPIPISSEQRDAMVDSGPANYSPIIPLPSSPPIVEAKSSSESAASTDSAPPQWSYTAVQRPQSALVTSAAPTVSTARLSLPSAKPMRPSSEADAMSNAISEFAIGFSAPMYTGKTPPQENSPSSSVNTAVSPVAVTVTDATTTTVATTPSSDGIAPSITSVEPRENTQNSRDSHTTTHLIWPAPDRGAVPVSSPDSAGQVEVTNDMNNDNITTNLRFSSHRSPATAHLPDVKEEPNEDNGLQELRVSGIQSPLPGSAEPKALPTRLRQDSDKPTSHHTPRSRALTESRAIPSLNFSRMDLFSKLNEALDLRSSHSLDGVPCDYPKIYAPVPERASSSVLVRDKYKSFFASLDDLDTRASDASRSLTGNHTPVNRPLSPEELITEVNRLSVPSVSGLTQRLSELIPSLKRLYSDVGHADDTVELTIKEIRGLGRIEPVVKEADLELIDNVECHRPRPRPIDVPRIAELPDTPSDSEGSSSRNSSASTNNEGGRITPLAELEAPLPAVIRPRSPVVDSYEELQNHERRLRLARSSKHSLIGSPASRPWNVEASYPWMGNTPNVDICLPPPAHHRDAAKPTPSRLRLRISDASSTASSDGSGTVKAQSARSPTTTGNSTQHTEDTFKRKSSKRSILGSISRKIGLSSPFDNSGYATNPNILRIEDRTVDPGDRYPTTGLSPPSAFNLEEVRSFFSDDSSQTERHGSFRKRLTHLKARLPPVTRSHSAMGHQSIGEGSTSVFGDSQMRGAGSVRTYDGAGGMSRTEFRARKIVEKIKTIWYRGGELIRSMSGKKRQPYEDEWSEQSDITPYSGV